MKILFYGVVILFLSTSCATSAQTPFAPPGATWYYSWTGMTLHGYYLLEEAGDTTIQNIPCKKITHSVYSVDFLGNTATYNYPNRFVYSDSDRVFLYRENAFDTLFDFSLQVGDHYKLSFGSECDTAVILITETGTMVINGEELRYYQAETGSDLNETWFFTGTITERIGGLTQWPFGITSCEIDSDWGNEFRCYFDPEFGSFESGVEPSCDYLVGINEVTIQSPGFEIFPNPARDILTLKFQGRNAVATAIELLDMQGRTLMKYPVPAHQEQLQLDISQLSGGVYMAKGVFFDGVVFFKRFEVISFP